MVSYTLPKSLGKRYTPIHELKPKNTQELLWSICFPKIRMELLLGKKRTTTSISWFFFFLFKISEIFLKFLFFRALLRWKNKANIPERSQQMGVIRLVSLQSFMGVRNTSFSENFANVLNQSSHGRHVVV